MLNPLAIMRRLATIDPLFQPTRSMLALLSAVEFVESQLREKKVFVSAELATKMATVKKTPFGQIIEKPTLTMESIRDTIIAIRAELPDSAELSQLSIPESVHSMRFVTSVEGLANALMSIIRALDLLPVAK